MKLLLDMNLSPAWSSYLNAAGHEAIHWSDIGPADASDAMVMDHARTHDAVVLTQDLDFGAILATTGGHKPSVVQIRADRLSPEIIGPLVLSALSQLESDLARGALLTIETARVRLSLLPLRPGP